jgi:hypothetical protein
MKSSSVSALRNKTDNIKKQTQITFKTPLQDKIVTEFTKSTARITLTLEERR